MKKALDKLPIEVRVCGFEENGWSCKSGVVECKRQFVSIMQELLDPQYWNKQIGAIKRRDLQ